MPTDHRAELARIERFDQLPAYLRDKLNRPIERMEIDELNNPRLKGEGFDHPRWGH